jgi:hypothetical protein
MQNQYNPWMGKAKPNYAGMRNDPRQLQQSQQDANGMQGWANAAPFIGTALGGVAGGLIGGLPSAGIGAVPGAGIGASVGGALGSAVGAGLNNQAQQKLDPFREKSMKEEAMWMALQGLR